MKAAMFRGPQDLSVIDIELPKIKDDEILIKVFACATCGTDAKIYNHGHPRLTPPQIIGHEIAGEVTEIGKNITKTKVGDRVQVIAAIPCGNCWTCNQGKMTICRNQLSMGYQFPGGFAQYMIIPKEVVVVDGVNKIPDNVSFDEAAVTEPLACAINAQQLVNVTNGDVVLVMGAGPIGCLHVQVARAFGAKKVFLADINPGRLKLSADVVKPDEVIDMSKEDIVKKSLELTDGIGPTVVITAAPSGQAQEQAISLVSPGGRISFFGGLPKDKPFINCDSNLVHYKELFLVGANGSSPQQNKIALEMISSGKVAVQKLITHKLSLAQVNKAIEAVLSGEAIKVVVNPND